MVIRKNKEMTSGKCIDLEHKKVVKLCYVII